MKRIIGPLLLSALVITPLVPINNANAAPVNISWTNSSESSGNWRGMASSSDGTKIYVAGMGGGLWKSTNSGESWTDITLNYVNASTNTAHSNTPYMVATNADGSKVAMITYNDNIYTSPDGGTTWTNRTKCGNGIANIACGTWEFIALSPDGTKLFVGGDSRGWYRASNVFTNPTSTFLIPSFTSLMTMNSLRLGDWSSGPSLSILSEDGSKLVALGPKLEDGSNGIYTSSDFGATWSLQNQSVTRFAADGTFICETAANQSGSHVYAHADNGNIYKSIDFGLNWTYTGKVDSTGCPWQEYTMSISLDGSSVALTAGGIVYYSSDFGVSFSDITTLSEAGSGWSVLTLTNAYSIVAGNNWNHIYRVQLPHLTVTAGSTPNSQVATIPAGVTRAAIPATASLPATSLNFGGTVPTAVTVVPVTTNPASAASTPFTISGSTKIVDIQISGTFTGSATVCLDGAETDHLFHYTGGAWVELPSRSYVGGQVCGVTTSFSPFAAAPPATVSLVSSNAAADAAAKAAAEAAAAKREAEKQAARADITSKLKSAKDLTVDAFAKAEIPGITATNIAAVQAELLALPEATRADINQVLKVAHKYEVVGNIGSDQINYMQSNSFIEIGLIPADSKNKVALVAAVRSLPEGSRDTYAEIKTAIDAEMARIQTRKDRLVAAITRNSNRYTK